MDSRGRVWVTARTRAPQEQPAFCKDGSINKFAKYFPIPGPSARQVEIYDPKTKQFTSIDTCFAADHNHFDEKDSIVFGQKNAIGWIDTAMFDKTHDAAASQGWIPAVLDTNGDGKITEWTEPDQPIDPKKDHRIRIRLLRHRREPNRWELVVLGNRREGYEARAHRSRGQPAANK